jgi:hypothetical protein
MMEVVSTSTTASVNSYQTKRQNIPEDGHLQQSSSLDAMRCSATHEISLFATASS